MLNTKCKIFFAFLFAATVGNSFAQKNIGSMLEELVGNYSTSKNGVYTFSISDKGATVQYFLKQFDYSESKGMYCCCLATSIYSFPKNFRASEELLQKISDVNAGLSPGSLAIMGSNLVYVSYFWDAELTTTVLGYEIVTAFYNTLNQQKDIDAFMNK